MPGILTELAGKAMGKAKAALNTFKGATGIMKTLSEEHGEVSVLMKRCKAASDAGSRKELFAEIREKLLTHAHAEQQEFYEPLQAFAETRDIATHSTREHQEIEAKIKALSAMDFGTQQWANLFAKLADTVTHHVREEENELFPKAQDALSMKQLDRMNERYLQAKRGFELDPFPSGSTEPPSPPRG